ncbi:hypothetical protein MMC26_007469 [Xylographa opegraphella]|nr:hypothetical protein [Xylographa opegraphella]
MSTSPATPTVVSGSKYSAKVAVPLVEKTVAPKVAQAAATEPSPASTYGTSAVGDSVPATPRGFNDPAIVARSGRTSDDVVARLSGLQLSREVGLTLVEQLSPSKVTTTGTYSASCSVSTGSNDSSLTENRTKDKPKPPTWRGDRENFVQGQADKDIFYVGKNNNNSMHPTGSLHPPTIINGVEVTNDNAQALLPPMACVFVANLSSTRTDEQLEYSVTRVFEQFGRVYVKIRRDNRSMPYAFAQYENVSDSERAIEHGRGIAIDGRQCRTERAKAHRSLYLSRVTGGAISEEEACDILKDFGPFEKVWVTSPTDKEMYRLPDGVWVMWAYFQGARDAQNAFKDHPKFRLEEPALPTETKSRVDRTNQSPLTRLTPGRSYETPQLRMWRTPDRSSVYVGGLPLSVTQAQLCTLFQAHGRVNGVEIISKPVNNAAAVGICVFAFVELGSEEEARCAVSQDYVLDGVRLRVEIKHSPVHQPHRANYMVSSGSPRRRTGAASPDSLGGMVNPSHAVGRALASGIHPALVSFIFSGVTGPQQFSPTTTMTNQGGIPPPIVAPPVFSQFPYDPTYYHTQFGPFGSPVTPGEAEISGGHFQYPSIGFAPYTMLPSYMYHQSIADVTGGDASTGHLDLH